MGSPSVHLGFALMSIAYTVREKEREREREREREIMSHNIHEQ
jgi:hypothetical protein